MEHLEKAEKEKTKIQKTLQAVIFSSKYWLLPFYFRLFWTLTKLIFYLFHNSKISNEQLISALEDVDITMIANLIKQVIIGSYSSFYDKYHGVEGEVVSSGALKVKISTSIMGIASIFLLKSFIALYTNPQSITLDLIYKLLLLFGIIIIASLVFSIIDYLHCKAESIHNQSQ